MDLDQYFLGNQQSNSQFPVFRGVRYQRGYGLGGVFRKLFRYIIPIVKEHGVPLLKTVGKTALKSAANLANDAIDGKDLKESAKLRLKETFENIKNNSNFSGNGLKNKKRKKLTRKVIKNQKRKLDIFD